MNACLASEPRVGSGYQGRMEKVSLLLQLDRELGLQAPVPHDEHSRSLLIDGMRVRLQLRPDATALLMESVVGAVDCQDAGLLYAMLEANYQACGTGGGTLWVDEQDRAVLSRTVAVAELGLGGLVESLGRFVDHVEYWRARVDGDSAPRKASPWRFIGDRA